MGYNMGGRGATSLGDNKGTDIDVKSGFHPSRGNKSGAEAVAGFYCNGSKASSSSHAIMAELRKAYSKMGEKK